MFVREPVTKELMDMRHAIYIFIHFHDDRSRCNLMLDDGSKPNIENVYTLVYGIANCIYRPEVMMDAVNAIEISAGTGLEDEDEPLSGITVKRSSPLPRVCGSRVRQVLTVVEAYCIYEGKRPLSIPLIISSEEEALLANLLDLTGLGYTVGHRKNSTVVRPLDSPIKRVHRSSVMDILIEAGYEPECHEF